MYTVSASALICFAQRQEYVKYHTRSDVHTHGVQCFRSCSARTSAMIDSIRRLMGIRVLGAVCTA